METNRLIDALGQALAVEKPGKNWDANKHVQWRLDVRAIASALSRARPAFNRSRFYAACDYDEEPAS